MSSLFLVLQNCGLILFAMVLSPFFRHLPAVSGLFKHDNPTPTHLSGVCQMAQTGLISVLLLLLNGLF